MGSEVRARQCGDRAAESGRILVSGDTDFGEGGGVLLSRVWCEKHTDDRTIHFFQSDSDAPEPYPASEAGRKRDGLKPTAEPIPRSLLMSHGSLSFL